MKKNRVSLVRRTFGVMLLMTLLMAAWLILQFVVLPWNAAQDASPAEGTGGIYEMFRQEMSVQYLHPILVPTVIYLVLMAVCAVYFLWQMRRQRLHKRKMLTSSAQQGTLLPGKEEPENIRAGREKRRRLAATGVCSAFCAGCVAVCIVQVINILRDPVWSRELLSRVLLTALPWATAVLAVLLALFAYVHLSHLREQAADSNRQQEADQSS